MGGMNRMLRHLWLVLLACVTVASAAGSSPALAQAKAPVILVLGDSLSAEYGLPRDTGWVSLLAKRLGASGQANEVQYKVLRQYSVANASISGETTSGGRTRLPALLKQHQPAIVILQLGANDGLRGLPLASMRENLKAMIGASQAAKARVLVVGIRMPPNFGRDYAERFFDTFGQLAQQNKTGYVPFLFEGFADQLGMFQADRIHPSEKAQPIMLENVWTGLRPLL
jgi:acyl-CoA thioesterase-1